MEYTRDERGNPIPKTDVHGNPIETDEFGNPLPANQGLGIGAGKEKLHRSGSSSSSSSSSEDDGQGGRRKKKKGLKEKIKEKLPGGHHKSGEEHKAQHEEGEHEKKGIMEKIKEKLPGHH